MSAEAVLASTSAAANMLTARPRNRENRMDISVPRKEGVAEEGGGEPSPQAGTIAQPGRVPDFL
jgi:hypothetical protein